MVRHGVWLFPEATSPELVGAFCDAEAMGLQEAWIGDEGPAHPDPFVVLAAAAVRTDHIRLGLAITNPYLRHPAVTASAMMTIHELSGGRGVLGFGPGGDVALDPVGVRPRRALTRTRDAVRIARAVARGQATDGYQPPPGAYAQPSLPVFIGARGEAFNRYASEAADGAFLGGIPFPMLGTVFGWARSLRPIEVALYPSVIVGTDDAEATRAHYIFAFHNTPASTRALAGVSADQVEAAVAAFEDGDDGPARALITDEVLSKLVIMGDPKQIGRRLAPLVSRYAPSSIGVCVRTALPLRERLADVEVIFAALDDELARA